MKRIMLARLMLAIFILSLLGLIGWALWAYDEPVPGPQPGRRIITPEVRRGEFLIVGAARVANSECQGWIYRQVTDANDDLIISETDFRPPALQPLPEKSVRRLLIPTYAALGEAHYDVTIQWSCNLLQRLFPVTEALPSLTFKIIDNPNLPKVPKK